MQRSFLILLAGLCILFITASISFVDHFSWADQPEVAANDGGSAERYLSSVYSILLSNSKAITSLPGSDQHSGMAPFTVHFITDSAGPVTTWRWDFNGDADWDWQGNFKENQSYTYRSTGSYTATLQVEDALGNTDEASITIAVGSDHAPEIIFTADAEQILEGQSTTLDWSVTGADAASISIDQGLGSVGASGTLSVVPVSTTAYTLSATGPGGSSSTSVEIRVISPAPDELAVYINDPMDGTEVDSDTLSVKGIISQDSALVWVNGVQAAVSDNTFSIDIPLVPGLNEINTTATLNDMRGEDSAWVIRNFTYIPQEEGSFGEVYEDLVPDDSAVPSYDEQRFAVITGRVADEQSAPLSGVTVTIKNHPEYGSVQTDSDGRFSLPVEGDTSYTLVCRLQGFITVHRTIDVRANDISQLDLLHMVRHDSKVTTVTFNGNPDTVITHVSSEITDASGSRAMTMVFSGDNRAWETDEQGRRIRELSTINTRATEFTSPESMPAILPHNSAFTYCAELSVDGVDRIEFDKPVITWVDNFLGFEVGETVPVGYYDRDKAAWVPTENGIVVKLLDADGDGIVDGLDINGDDTPDDLNNDTETTDEVLGLGDPSRYAPDSTFWRVPVRHFTPYDENWAWIYPLDAIFPDPDGSPAVDEQNQDPQKDKDDCENDIASSVEPRSRILHENIHLPGTNTSLHYTSNRSDGYIPLVNVPVSGAAVPASLRKIIVQMRVAGTIVQQELDPLPNQTATIAWDRLDYLGNRVNGTVTATIRIGYTYETEYGRADPNFDQGFAQPATVSTGVGTRELKTMWTEKNVSIADPVSDLAAGWTISNHHSIHPGNKGVIYKGTGKTVRQGIPVIDSFAGDPDALQVCNVVDGMPADKAIFKSAEDIARDSKGNFYISSKSCNKVYKITSDGLIYTYAGSGVSNPDDIGDGGPAREAWLYSPEGLAVDSRDNLYIADYYNNRIRKVDSNGIITTYAGNNYPPPICNNNCLATDNTIQGPEHIVMGPDDTLYVAQTGRSRIGKISPNGLYTMVVGCISDLPDQSDCNYLTVSPEGTPALKSFISPSSLALGPDGNIYFARDGSECIISKVDEKTGIVTVVAGQETCSYDTGDGGLATDAVLYNPKGLTFDDSGNMYILTAGGGERDNSNRLKGRIRRVDLNGIISTFAGPGADGSQSGDGGPAILATDLSIDWGDNRISFYNNTLYFSETARFRKISLPATEIGTVTVDPGNITFAEKNGTGHIFSSTGQHLQTIDLATSVVLQSFTYNTDKQLTTITDQFGRAITIQYNSSGIPVSITSPDNLITALSVDGDNNLTRITYPDGSHYDFTYAPGGLLKDKTEPSGNIFHHSFDGLGRLTTVNDAEGGQWTYGRTTSADGTITVDVTTAENNITTYTDRTLSTGSNESVVTYPSGSSSPSAWTDEGLANTSDLACGMHQTSTYNTDVLYKTVYNQSITTSTPAGLSQTVSFTRNYTDDDGDDRPDLITDTVILNDKTSTLVHDIPASTQTAVTAAGRTTTVTYDPATLLPLRYQIPGINDTVLAYDANGRINSVTRGDRVQSITYDPNTGFVNHLTSAEGRSSTLTTDPVGRVTSVLTPDGSETGFQYDGNGNLIAIITPSGTSHQFSYNNVNLISSYTLPDSGGDYTFTYNKERRLTNLTYPSGAAVSYTFEGDRLKQTGTGSDLIDISYLSGNRVDTMTRGAESVSYVYDGRLVLGSSWSGTLNQSLSMLYNNDFLPTQLSYAGDVETFSYDDDGTPINVSGFTITRLGGNGFPNKVSDTVFEQNRTFNGFGELDAETTTVNSLNSAGWSVSRNKDGLVITASETINGTTRTYAYTYDSMGQLLESERDGTRVESYTYDDNGNRLSDLAGNTYSYDSQDRLTAMGNTGYSFNADGFLVSKTAGVDTTTYTYSTRGELVSVTLPDGTAITYSYDPMGRRIARSVNGTVTEKYLWAGKARLLAVLDGSGDPLIRFRYADRRVPVSMTMAGSTYYLIFDRTDSLRLVTDTAGTAVKQIDYNSFGRITSDSAPALQIPLGFAGGLTDADTGLVHFTYRDYDPESGRWTAKDPLLFNAGEINLYLYAGNNPVNVIDPDGLFWNELADYAQIGWDTLTETALEFVGVAGDVTALAATIGVAAASSGVIVPAVAAALGLKFGADLLLKLINIGDEWEGGDASTTGDLLTQLSKSYDPCNELLYEVANLLSTMTGVFGGGKILPNLPGTTGTFLSAGGHLSLASNVKGRYDALNSRRRR